METENYKPLFARQSIYDCNHQVLAFELLFRQDEINESGIDINDDTAGNRATSSVLVEFFANVNIDELVGDRKVYINFTRNHIIEGIPHSLPYNRITIELLETINYNEEMINCIKALKEAKYTIALDDFEYQSSAKQIIQYADIIKIDVLKKSDEEIRKSVEELSDFKGIMLAEKIETQERFEYCKSLGFDLFQGFFLDKPTIIKGNEIGPLKINMLKLISELQNPDIEFFDIEQIINSDPKLTYRLLLIANSAAISMGKKATSISEALIRLGIKNIRVWLSLLILSKMDDTPLDLLEKAIFRAKMCEMLAHKIGAQNPQTYYTVGLISSLNAILKITMDEIVSKMNLSDEINQALLTREGILGQILTTVQDVEQANFSKLALNIFSRNDISMSYMESLKDARQMIQNLLH